MFVLKFEYNTEMHLYLLADGYICKGGENLLVMVGATNFVEASKIGIILSEKFTVKMLSCNRISR